MQTPLGFRTTTVYDLAGQVTASVDALSHRTSYSYDNADRLTGQQVVGGSATFTMDSVGNILVKAQEGSQPMTMSCDAACRLVTMQDGPTRVTYSYDANGNVTSEQRGAVTTQFEYDRENRIVVRQEGIDRVTMTFDGSGLRRSRHMNGVLTTYIWDGSDYLMERS